MAQENQNNPQDAGNLLQIRRDKLTALQAEGRDPFEITRFDWDHTSGQIRERFD